MKSLGIILEEVQAFHLIEIDDFRDVRREMVVKRTVSPDIISNQKAIDLQLQIVRCGRTHSRICNKPNITCFKCNK